MLRRQGGALARMGDRIPDDVTVNYSMQDQGAPVPSAVASRRDNSAVAGVDDAEAVAFRIRKYDVWIAG